MSDEYDMLHQMRALAEWLQARRVELSRIQQESDDLFAQVQRKSITPQQAAAKLRELRETFVSRYP